VGGNSGLPNTTKRKYGKDVFYVAKEVVKRIKLQIPAGKATPAPPVGTVLGPAGINLQEFCTKYNDATKDKMGDIIPVEISVYDDRSFDFVLKTPPAAELIKKYAKIKSGSKKGAHEIVATISKDDVKAIAEIKLPDLNAYTVEEAMKIVEGTARNMGVAVKGVNDAELAEEEAEAREAEIEEAKREAKLEAMEASASDTNVETEVITEKESTEE
jgi:large subunit ribosomal protein L11